MFLGSRKRVIPNPLVIAVNRKVFNIIFAHRLLETRIWEGEPPGKIIAHYEFHFMDGHVHSVPVRERFEIGPIPAGWGLDPFLAWTDEKPDLSRAGRAGGKAGDRARLKLTREKQKCIICGFGKIQPCM